MKPLPENRLWDIRAFVYRHFADTTHAPGLDETAAAFALTQEQAASAFEDLHHRHAFFLAPGAHEILMANPFSGIETPFRVHADGKTYYANCAWDSLGIPAALHADADVEAVCSQSRQPINLQVRAGHVSTSGALVHFLVPFEHWYDDLVFT
ncbi:MAG: organomercurial lyase [Chloroflexota bacterium]